MEEVEGANRAAVESCNKVLNLLSQPALAQDQLMRRNLMVGTGEAVGKFQKVASLLGRTVGHARARMSKNPPIAKFPMAKGLVFDQSEKVEECQSRSFLKLKSDFDENMKQESGVSVTRSAVYSENPSPSLEIGLSFDNQAAQIGKPLQITSAHQHHQLLQQQQMQQHQLMKYRFQQQQQAEMMFNRSNSGMSLNFESSSCTPTMSTNRSFMSSLSMDGSVANVNGSALRHYGASHSLDHSLQKKKCNGRGENGSLKCGSSRCHCLKKRKHRVKRSIKVPAISNKQADIPPDDYSWRKYGQKPIKGSPHPRGYYKCSSTRGCPARKHVERSLEEPEMLIVTYEGEHNHPRSAAHELPDPILP